jgi:hypothetical protein
MFDERFRQFLLASGQASEADIPLLSHFFLCLWLNERSLTFEAPQLHRHGVGGVFHYF